MRTTVDIPDKLLERVKPVLLKRGLTLRAVVTNALEDLLAPADATFRMRDASAGYQAKPGRGVSAAQINAAIEDLAESNL